MYLFWDNSNIHYSGLDTVFPMIEPGKQRELYRTYFKNLFELARNGRTVEGAYAAGSVPPPSDDLWAYLKKLGIDMTLLDKTADGKEQDSVDMSLQTNMFRVALDNSPGTMVLLTGDGSGGALGKGFLADLQRIHKLGWNIEVYAWESTCNRYLKEFAEQNGVFVPLEKYYYSITFLKGERVVKPL
ncbi:NYN domain-containing protein [Flintibacter sp. P01028]|uniref:NYN domain-containing protein n=1 Tax=Flintibacter sp. P01028 TaxID=3342382 RepID=UPI0035B690EA